MITFKLGLDNKIWKLIRQTLTDTKSKIKFIDDISEPLLMKTGVRWDLTNIIQRSFR